MKYRLSLDPIATPGEGPNAARAIHHVAGAILYKVLGLPSGEEAWIKEVHTRWQILRVKDGASSDCAGDYGTAEEALAALQRKYD